MFALRHNLQASFLVYHSHDFLKEVLPSSGKEIEARAGSPNWLKVTE